MDGRADGIPDSHLYHVIREPLARDIRPQNQESCIRNCRRRLCLCVVSVREAAAQPDYLAKSDSKHVTEISVDDSDYVISLLIKPKALPRCCNDWALPGPR